MKKYKFPQFSVEIIDPKVTIDQNSIQINNATKTISVSVVLETASTKLYGVQLKDIPRNSEGWDTVDLPAVVALKLSEFEVV